MPLSTTNLTPSAGVLFGSWCRERFPEDFSGGSPVSSEQIHYNFENHIGRQMGLVGSYMHFDDWKTSFPGSYQQRWANGGRLLFFRWKPDQAPGTAKWQDIADGVYDSYLTTAFTNMKNWQGGTGAGAVDTNKFLLAFHHEFDGDDYLTYGNAGDTAAQGLARYKAAFTHIRSVRNSVGATNALLCWVVTGGSTFNQDKWLPAYPGDANVDWLGFEPYNLFCITGSNWRWPTENWSAFLSWAQTNAPTPPIMIGEFGVGEHADASGTLLTPSKAEWFRNGTQGVIPTLKKAPYSRIKAISYFHSSLNATDIRCEGWIDSTTDSNSGFITMANDPLMFPDMSVGTGGVDVLQPAGPPGVWQLTYSEDFSSALDTINRWHVTEGWTNQNNVTTRAANITVTGGELRLRLSTTTEGALMTADPAFLSGGPGIPVRVGDYAEARVYFPGQDGVDPYWNWPAWWMTAEPSWPAQGEHDIAEVLGSIPNISELTVNYQSPSGAHNQGAPAGDWNNAFHTYGIHRKTSSADVYWDGVLVKSYTTDDNGAPNYPRFNIGKDLGRTPVTGVTSELRVDWMRIWKPTTTSGAIAPRDFSTGSNTFSATPIVTVPSATKGGDLIGVWFSTSTTTPTITNFTAGYQLQTDVVDGTSQRTNVAWKIAAGTVGATSSDAGTTVGPTLSATGSKTVLFCFVYSGADSTAPITAVGISETTTQTTHTTPSLTTADNGSWVLSIWSDRGTVVGGVSTNTTQWALPAGEVTRGELYLTGSAATTFIASDTNQPHSPGSYGGKIANSDFSNNNAVQWTILINPAVSSTGSGVVPNVVARLRPGFIPIYPSTGSTIGGYSSNYTSVY